MRITTTCLALAGLLLLTQCGSGNKAEDQDPTLEDTTNATPHTTTQDLASAEARLAALEAQLSTLPGNNQDITTQVVQFDELGNLWKAPAEGYMGWAGDSSFSVGLGNMFQDSQNLSLYHAQGRQNVDSRVYKWVGSVEIARSQDLATEANGTTLQGVSLAKFELVENEGRPEQATYKGVALAYFTFDPDSESMVKTPASQLPASTPAVLFEGYKINRDSTEVLWTVWGLGEEEDIRAGIQLPATVQ